MRKPDRERRKALLIELSVGRFLLFCIILLASYLWAFGLGLTIGRSVMVKDDESFLKKLALFLGYRQPSSEEVWKIEASKTWTPLEQMEKELGYYNALVAKAPEKPDRAKVEVSTTDKEAEKEGEGASEVIPDVQQAEKKVYTVLAASFQNQENAKKLMSLLKSKGYPVTVESVPIRDSVWYRVVVGNFQNREDALRFVGMFNSKEGLQGIVIQR